MFLRNVRSSGMFVSEEDSFLEKCSIRRFGLKLLLDLRSNTGFCRPFWYRDESRRSRSSSARSILARRISCLQFVPSRTLGEGDRFGTGAFRSLGLPPLTRTPSLRSQGRLVSSVSWLESPVPYSSVPDELHRA